MDFQEMNDVLNERIEIMLKDPKISKAYKKFEKSEGTEKANEWISRTAMFTLMYSPDEREEMILKESNKES